MFKNMSLVPKGLRCKTMIAFSLMSLIPLLICGWIVTNYIFPNINFFPGLSFSNMSFILFVCIFLSLAGLYITRQMIDPVVDIANNARMIANGDLERVIAVEREDEIGDLTESLNIMTKKIKDNIDELKAYGEMTKTINLEINKRVFILSNLLQIGNFISSSSELKGILDFIIKKIVDIEDNSSSFLMLKPEGAKDFKVASSCNLDEDKILALSVAQDEVLPNIAVLDKNTPSKANILNSIARQSDLKNIIMLPIMVVGRIYGILVFGTVQNDFIFTDDEKELLKVFAKQVAIAIENDLLIKKTKELSIKDELTGLYNENYIKNRLGEEIERAMMYERPCGYLLIDIDDFKNFHSLYGELKSELLLKNMAELLKKTTSEVDKVGRLEGDKFAIILPEKNKKQTASFAEDVRKKIEQNLSKMSKSDKALTASIGVSENPIDGSSREELMDKAEKLLRAAKSLGKNRVAV